MVVPPTPWTGMLGGGYVTPRGQGSMTLIKTRNLKLYSEADISPDMLEAINAIQETPWCINRKVYAVMRYCADNSLEIGELPVMERESLVGEMVPPDEWEILSPEEKREVFNTRKAAHKEADSTSSKVFAFRLKLNMARRFLKYEKIYFPHTYDFRGRIYPIASPVNPQSDHFGQALLLLAERECLGPTGEYWLGIGGANAYGLDSESYASRTTWIAENTDKIIAAAENPIRDAEFWGQADDPYGFLAFCIEWAGMHECDDHTQYLCGLPIKLDATSSGLQHYSAIFRDERGAVATNLVDGERQDIYKKVAEETITILSQALETEKDLEQKQMIRSYIPIMNRTLCKPATMCLPYGISLFGATDALMELKAKGKFENVHLTENKEGMAKARYLAQAIMDGVSTVVSSAVIGMDWLKKVDKAITKVTDTQEPRYVTALGFPFYQQYYKSERKRIKAFFGDVLMRLTAHKTIPRLDKRKSNSAIAPNFIHAQDATHLALTALTARRAGIKSFSFIHDSFGVLPSRTEAFRDIIREQFVALYSGDTLKGLIDQLKVQYPTADLPAPPYESYGVLDINDCKKSSYMFN